MQAENKQLSHFDAESESVLLRTSVESGGLKNAFLEQLAVMSKEPAEHLAKIVALDLSTVNQEIRSTYGQIQKTAEVALMVKQNPALLAEMMTDPSHPRLLDLYDTSFDILKLSSPENYRKIFDRENLIAELKMMIGEELYLEVSAAISKTNTELQDPSINYPEVLRGAPTGLLAITVLRKREPFATNPKLTPNVWGKLFAFIGAEIDLEKMRE